MFGSDTFDDARASGAWCCFIRTRALATENNEVATRARMRQSLRRSRAARGVLTTTFWITAIPNEPRACIAVNNMHDEAHTHINSTFSCRTRPRTPATASTRAARVVEARVRRFRSLKPSASGAMVKQKSSARCACRQISDRSVQSARGRELLLGRRGSRQRRRAWLSLVEASVVLRSRSRYNSEAWRARCMSAMRGSKRAGKDMG